MIDLEQVKKKVEELRQRLEWGRPYSYDLEQALAITSDLIVEVELYKKLYEEAQEVYAFSVKTENDLQCEKEDLDKQHVFRIAELKHKLDMINSTNQRHVEEIESLQREKAELEDDKSELAGDLYRKMSKAAELERQQLKSWHDTMGGITTRNGYQFGLSDDPATCSMMILHFIDKLEKQLAEITLRREETVMANEHLMEQVCGMRKAWEHILVLGYHGMGCNKCFKYHDAMASASTCGHKVELTQVKEKLVVGE
ncbi:MAG: hypothetical protein U1E51_20325, partial [Candidatus Binatia bacterium]|nr:hypothetical protein [Candidatus Binatia bacterium]